MWHTSSTKQFSSLRVFLVMLKTHTIVGCTSKPKPKWRFNGCDTSGVLWAVLDALWDWFRITIYTRWCHNWSSHIPTFNHLHAMESKNTLEHYCYWECYFFPKYHLEYDRILIYISSWRAKLAKYNGTIFTILKSL